MKNTKTNYGSYIRDQAIKNLLSAQKKIAESKNTSAIIVLTKFILKISHKFDNEILYLGLETKEKDSEEVRR